MPPSSIATFLLAWTLALAANAALACPEERQWSDFSSISLSADDAAPLRLTRFSNGMHATIGEGDSRREMYHLNNGWSLYKGLTDSEKSGVSPFFMLDVPIGMVLDFLRQAFPQPCRVEAVETPFAYSAKPGGGSFVVAGRARRTAESAVVFAFSATEEKDRGARFNARGRVEFDPIATIPGDTDVSGWTLARGANLKTPPELAGTNRAFKRIDEVLALPLEKRTP